MATMYTKWPQCIPNGNKIDQMANEYANIFHYKTLQNLPKSEFLVWFENMPSGNPGMNVQK
jgi:hypothetical protein